MNYLYYSLKHSIMEFLEKIKNYEFDIIELPSRGLFYDLGRSYIYIKFLTAKEENILTSPFLSEYGIALDIALQSVILDDIKVDDLLSVDRKAIIMFLRSKAISDAFNLDIECSNCRTKFEQEFRFSNFEMSDTVEEPEDGFYSMIFRLQDNSDKRYNIKFKPLTYGYEKVIKKNYPDKFSTYEIIYQICSINDFEDREYIQKFVQHMPIKKFQLLKNKIDKIVPKIFEQLETECISCGHKEKSDFKIDDGLLKFDPTHRTNLEKEIFLIQYYGKGGFNKSDICEMSIGQRRTIIESIQEEVEKKNKAEQDAADKAKKSSRTK